MTYSRYDAETLKFSLNLKILSYCSTKPYFMVVSKMSPVLLCFSQYLIIQFLFFTLTFNIPSLLAYSLDCVRTVCLYKLIVLICYSKNANVILRGKRTNKFEPQIMELTSAYSYYLCKFRNGRIETQLYSMYTNHEYRY